MKNLLVLILLQFLISSNCVIQAQWIQTAYNPNGAYVYCLAADGTDIICGTNGNGSSSAMYRSSNNGMVWTQVNNGLPNFAILSITVNGTDIYAGTLGDGIYLSTNNGANWTAVNNGLTNKYVYALTFIGNNIFAGTYFGGVFLTTNRGANWTQVGLNNNYVYSFAVSGANLFAGTGDGGVYFSSNNGTNWAQVKNGLTNLYVRSLAINGSNIFAGTFGGGVFLSTNNGAMWTSTGLSNYYIYSFAVNGTSIFAGTYGGVFLTTNDGTSWRLVSGSLTDTLVRCLAISGTNIFAGTFEAGVWRRSIAEFTGISNDVKDLPLGYLLFQNYPNPFNPNTKITYWLKEKGFVKLKVYDIRGELVKVLVNETKEAGNYEAEFNGKGLASGVYIYRIEVLGDGNNLVYSDMKKTVLLK